MMLKYEKKRISVTGKKDSVKKGTQTVIIVISIFIGSVIGTVATLAAVVRYQHIEGRTPMDQKLNAIWNIVEENYVDPIESDSVMDRLYASMLNTLDPHSNYLSRSDLERENEFLRGNFEGVGIVLQIRNDTVCASRIVEGGPAESVGLLAGDRILKVDGKPVSGVNMPSDSVVARLRGRRKSVVDVEIKRFSEARSRVVKITRDVIPTPSLSYCGMIDSRTGYIRLTRFGESTYNEFFDAVRDLKQKGMKRMVLDLRDNGGGVLSSAIAICDELLPGRELIVYTEGTHQKRREHRSSPGGLLCDGELIVMIDEYSASASEIVAGAIQDNDRGVVVGRRSFGKGLVQQQFELPDESAILLTIARYYTPSGRCIQRPYNNGSDEYYADFARQLMEAYDTLYEDVERYHEECYHIKDTTTYYTSKGRVVYGGGGIMPDHTIQVKTDPDIIYYNQLINKGIMNEYTFDIVSRNAVSIRSQYKTADDFVSRYKVSDAMLGELFKLGEKKGLIKDPVTISKYREEIRSRIKAEIGEMLYSTGTFYRIMLPYDRELKEANAFGVRVTKKPQGA